MRQSVSPLSGHTRDDEPMARCPKHGKYNPYKHRGCPKC